MSYLRQAGGRRATPQRQPIPGASQVPNSSGGFVWEVDPLTRLRRWLILGSEGGSYYASEQQLTTTNVSCLSECDPVEALLLIHDVSAAGRAPKADPALYALAFYAGHRQETVRKMALESAFPAVVRTGTHMLHFIDYVEKQRGWGRSLRRAVGKWFVDNPVEAVAYQAIKYRQRDGWSQRDALRLAHPGAKVSSGNPTLPVSQEHAQLFDWICGRKPNKAKTLPDPVRGFRKAQRAGKSPAQIAELITEYKLPREAIPPEFLTEKVVWEALLHSGLWGMPVGALVRNLPTMTRVGLLKPMGRETAYVVDRLHNKDAILSSRIHPLQLLIAQLTYKAGYSIRGDSQWQPVTDIVDALDGAFYLSFGNVESDGKSKMLAIDVSGSMASHTVNGIPGLSPRVAAGAMALVWANIGDPCVIVGFSANTSTSGSRLRTWGGHVSTDLIDPDNQEDWAIKPLAISKRQRLDDACRTMQELQAGGTDIALPMLYAQREHLPIDTFIVLTDNESWAGKIHPAQALQQYREKSGLKSRLAVVAMVANQFSVADPQDPLQMDVVGFDTATPQIVQDFAGGRL